MIRKSVILGLTFMTLATALLWADSYRRRVPKPLSPDQQESFRHAFLHREPTYPLGLIGLRLTRYFPDLSDWRTSANRRILRIRTRVGRLELRLFWGIKTGTYVPRVDVGLAGFRHKQWMWTASIMWGENGEPDIHDQYHVREIHAPFAALVALFGFYPAWTAYSGPMRRRRRRTKGLCLRCGYDLSGNLSGVCPECGVEITRDPGA